MDETCKGVKRDQKPTPQSKSIKHTNTSLLELVLRLAAQFALQSMVVPCPSEPASASALGQQVNTSGGNTPMSKRVIEIQGQLH